MKKYILILLLTLVVRAENIPFLVKFKENADQEKVLSEIGGKKRSELDKINTKVVEIPEQAAAVGFLRLLLSEEVEYAEADTLIAPQPIPNDPFYSHQWFHENIKSPTAWDMTVGSPDVIIAILDSGVYNHDEFAGRFVPGWNFYDQNTNTDDVTGHGTAVAGCAAAAGNNGIGVAGVSWNCKLMPLRISQPDGYAYLSTIATGLTWAADRGARVANISYLVNSSSSVASAAQYFMSKGGVVVNSAGNQASVLSYANSPYLVTVSATTSSDTLSSFSNQGSYIDLSAPGSNIATTSRNNDYQSWNGTSFSSPIVAGVAALIISVNPGLSADQIRNILTESADDLGPVGWDQAYGFGRVNASRAVVLASQTTPAPTPTPTPTPEPEPTPTPKPPKGKGRGKK